jgi:MYXO-CTERM domain-containing protein
LLAHSEVGAAVLLLALLLALRRRRRRRRGGHPVVIHALFVVTAAQGLTLIRVRAQLEQLQDTFMS